MPGISGLGVLQWMRERKMETPVIMVTAAGSEDIAVESMKLGAYDYVRKEQLDIDHIGILMNGVIERHLFREEKTHREQMEREREKSLLAVETFHTTLASVAQMVNNSVTLMLLKVRRYEKELQPYVTAEGQGRLPQVFADVRQEYGAISNAIMSMLGMAEYLHQMFGEPSGVEEPSRVTSDSLMSTRQPGVRDAHVSEEDMTERVKP